MHAGFYKVGARGLFKKSSHKIFSKSRIFFERNISAKAGIKNTPIAKKQRRSLKEIS